MTPNTPGSVENLVKDYALEVGFDLVGIASADPFDDDRASDSAAAARWSDGRPALVQRGACGARRKTPNGCYPALAASSQWR